MENLIFNVAQLLKAPVGSSIAYDLHEDDVQLDEDIKVVGPLNGHVRMRRTNQGLLLDGWVELTLELSCTRCLKTLEQPMHVNFEEQFYPTIDVITGLPSAPFAEEEIDLLLCRAPGERPDGPLQAKGSTGSAHHPRLPLLPDQHPAHGHPLS